MFNATGVRFPGRYVQMIYFILATERFFSQALRFPLPLCPCVLSMYGLVDLRVTGIWFPLKGQDQVGSNK